ncbi:MAG: aldehyde dehydrogenase family protein [Gordonia sp. (in: high G+C Gram-positive bacteria)]
MTSIRRAPAAVFGDHEVHSSEQIEVIDPYRGVTIGTTGAAGPEIVADAVASAAAAQRAWSAVEPSVRASVLRRTAELINDPTRPIAATVTAEMGMPATLAKATQQVMPAAVLRAMADAAETFTWDRTIDGARLRHVPAGVVAAISPWNMPVHQIVAKVAAAVAAGCAVVLKPSEMTPFDALLVRNCFLDAGLPAGVFTIVNGTGPVTGNALTSHPGVAHVSFTGSVEAGRAVARAAAGNLVRTTLELGGKSPAVVLPDADLDTVIARVVASGLVNSGQACNATTRLVLPRAQQDRIERLLIDATAAAVLGDPTDPATTMGPLASARQTERVLDHIEKARADGGRLLTGSGQRESVRTAHGFTADGFIAPTIICELGPSARAVREEIFGPVLVTQYYDDVDEAVAIANDCAYGLSAEVWSARTDAAREVAAALEVGQVKINGVRTRERPAVPFGGMKLSGYGRELGATGLAEFTEIQAVMS